MSVQALLEGYKYSKLSMRIDAICRSKRTPLTVKTPFALHHTIPVHRNSIWFEKCTRHLPVRHVHNTVFSQVETCPCSTRRYSNLFAHAMQARKLYPSCSVSLEGGWRHFEFEKVRSFTNKIDYRGDIIRPSRLDVANNTTDAIGNLKISTTQTKQRSLAGFSNVFRWLLQNFAGIASLLMVRLCNSLAKELGQLSKEQPTALGTLLEKLTSPPVFA